MTRVSRFVLCGSLLGMSVAGCSQPPTPPPSADTVFQVVADEFVSDFLKRNPSAATYLGVHDYDDQLEDPSRAAVDAEIASLKQFRQRFAALEPGVLTAANQLDRLQAMTAIDSRLLDREVIKPWARNPDTYSSGLTQTAYIMIKRNFAPPAVRLKALIAREKLMVKVFDAARVNLDNPPPDLHGHRARAGGRQPRVFRYRRARSVHLGPRPGPARRIQDDQPGGARWVHRIQDLPGQGPQAAIARQVCVRRRHAGGQVRGRRDDRRAARSTARHRPGGSARNTDAFNKTAALIAPGRTPRQVLDVGVRRSSRGGRPVGGHAGRDSTACATSSKSIALVTMPASVPAKVVGDAAVHARLDVGVDGHARPVRDEGAEAYYNVTLPDPKWPAARRRELHARAVPAGRSPMSRSTRSTPATTSSFSMARSFHHASARSTARQQL